jgi:hypothetical protein
LAAGARGSDDVTYPPDYYKAQGLPPPPWAMSGKEYDKYLSRVDKTKPDAAIQNYQLHADQDVAKRQMIVGDKEWQAPDQETRRDLDLLVAKSTNYVQIVDALQRAVDKHGWSSSTLKSKEWREAQVLWSQAAFEKKDIETLGALAGPDVDMIAKAMGTKDPTEIDFSDSIVDGLRASRRLTVRGVNNQLRVRGKYRGKEDPFAPPEFTNRGLEKQIKNTPAEQLTKDLEATDARAAKRWDLKLAKQAGAPGAEPIHGQVSALVARAKLGDDDAARALAMQARKRPYVAQRAIGAGVDLSPYLTPEEWAAMQDPDGED